MSINLKDSQSNQYLTFSRSIHMKGKCQIFLSPGRGKTHLHVHLEGVDLRNLCRILEEDVDDGSEGAARLDFVYFINFKINKNQKNSHKYPCAINNKWYTFLVNVSENTQFVNTHIAEIVDISAIGAVSKEKFADGEKRKEGKIEKMEMIHVVQGGILQEY